MDPYERKPEGYEAGDGAGAGPLDPAGGPAPEKPNPSIPGVIKATSVFCVQCGYNLTGVAIGANCPECGRTVAPSFHSQMLPTSGKAITSLVLGICSIPVCMLYGIPAIICGVLAIIFARIAKAQVGEGEASPTSNGMATAGMICGIIGLCLGLIYVGGVAIFLFSFSP